MDTYKGVRVLDDFHDVDFLVWRPLALGFLATYTLVASINSETQRCDAPICLRIPATHSYAAALSGHTMMTSCMSSNSCTRTPHLNTSGATNQQVGRLSLTMFMYIPTKSPTREKLQEKQKPLQYPRF
jgi:hypothetical protein